MLTISRFQLVIDDAPCPPFFVENVYSIFIDTAENNNLNATDIQAIWTMCVAKFPDLTTTSTTSTTEQTTTLVTSTTERTTTSTSSTTTTTTEQVTTSTTPTSTAEQTNTTRSTTDQTTPSSTPQTVSTTQKTTTSSSTFAKQTTTLKSTKAIREQTASSTTPTTLTLQTPTSNLPSSTTFEETTSSTTVTTGRKTTSANLTTEISSIPTSFTSSAQCSGHCLTGVLMFSACVLVGVLAIAVLSYKVRRRRSHTLKHRDSKKKKNEFNHQNIPEFSKRGRYAYFSDRSPAFENPLSTMFITGTFQAYVEPYQNPAAHDSEIQRLNKRDTTSQDNKHFNHDVFFYKGKSDFDKDRWKSSSYRNDRSKEFYRPDYIPLRHSTIRSHVPKMISCEENNFIPYIELNDRKSALKDVDTYYSDTRTGKYDHPVTHGLPRVPFENKTSHTEFDIQRDRYGLPRVPFENKTNHTEFDIQRDRYGLPRVPFENKRSNNFNIQQERFHHYKTKKENDTIHSYLNHSYQHELPRLPFEPLEKTDGENVMHRRPGLWRVDFDENQTSDYQTHL